MSEYKCLKLQHYQLNDFSLIPVRFEDRFLIMKWRNEQMYHLRQNRLLTFEDQNNYFLNIVGKEFDQDAPKQILFSFLKSGECIGYGGLVHINWIDKNAELSFIMSTDLEELSFSKIWRIYLELIEKVVFVSLGFHKMYTYAFDIRPQLYSILENAGFDQEARLKEQCFYKANFIDVVIHSKFKLKD